MIDEKLLNFTKCDVFTPNKISELMSQYLYNSGNLLEPSVGDGQLLKYINFEKYNEIDIYDIKKEYLDKCINANNITKYHKDFLYENIYKKYKNIILNPPFIKIQDLSIEYINFIKDKWNLSGNIDIYYAFLYKCLELLDDDGVMISITPNSYLYTLSAKKFREYLLQNKFIEEIIDYKEEKIFPKINVYCCITIFTKKNKETFLYNKQIYNYNNKKDDIFSVKILNDQTLKNICKITNGIATLRDKIYIHKEKLYDEPIWLLTVVNKSILKFFFRLHLYH